MMLVFTFLLGFILVVLLVALALKPSSHRNSAGKNSVRKEVSDDLKEIKNQINGN